jgi:hypothetical protein
MGGFLYLVLWAQGVAQVIQDNLLMYLTFALAQKYIAKPVPPIGEGNGRGTTTVFVERGGVGGRGPALKIPRPSIVERIGSRPKPVVGGPLPRHYSDRT